MGQSLQDPLEILAILSGLHGLRHGGHQLDQSVIEQRLPSFKRHRHGRPVDFYEQIIRQVDLRIQEQQRIKTLVRSGNIGIEGVFAASPGSA